MTTLILSLILKPARVNSRGSGECCIFIFITAVLLLFKISVVASTITDTLYITIVSEASIVYSRRSGKVFCNYLMFSLDIFIVLINKCCFSYQP